MFSTKNSKYSISQDCIREIPLNPPLQKGEEVGIPRLIEILQKIELNKSSEGLEILVISTLK
jgi:hypothetical protein